MKRFGRLTTVGVVVVAGMGLAATGASAYSISGGSYVGTATSDHSETVGVAYTITCPAALTTFAGVATGSATTSFTPYYGGTDDCEFFGFPTTVSQSGQWQVTVTGGPDANGWYTGSLHIPSGTSTTLSIPITGCTKTVSGPQTFTHDAGLNIIRMRNVAPTGVVLEAAVNGIAYAASGCPYPNGTDGTYSTNGLVDAPGITIS